MRARAAIVYIMIYISINHSLPRPSKTFRDHDFENVIKKRYHCICNFILLTLPRRQIVHTWSLRALHHHSNPRHVHRHKPCSIQDLLQRLEQSHIGRVGDIQVTSHQSKEGHTADASPPFDHVHSERAQRHLAARTLDHKLWAQESR